MITDERQLQEIDLTSSRCPQGLQVEIEGYKPMGVSIPNVCLVEGISAVHASNTGNYSPNVQIFASRITLLALDVENRYVKVRIA